MPNWFGKYLEHDLMDLGKNSKKRILKPLHGITVILHEFDVPFNGSAFICDASTSYKM